MNKILVDESVLKQALEALKYMHTEKCDYMRRNNLGDPLRENSARLAVPTITALRAALAQQAKPPYTTGHCKEKAKPGGCRLHNLQCGYPDCDRKPAALAQQEQSLPDNCDISQRTLCQICDHIQVVKGSRFNGQNYFGSGYDWCDNCGDGNPEPIGVVMVDN